MTEPIISVENLGKKYLLRHQQPQSYVALRDVMTEGVKSLGKRLLGRSQPTSSREEFWALKDVSFAIQPGDRVGIIGRNGAGKSTLLKILSRITEPTVGKIRLRGRVASLLEVGTGFHPELTGRENIFLNGAILGMGKGEIQKKFDEIVAFAEVEKFLDTPVKHYSSGMYVRLAFAVAAHLEPEILVVDEVLAVGDAEFQKKCLGKMEDVATNEGRTVLFVSHSMGTITRLCNTGIYLRSGEIAAIGEINSVVSHYLTSHIEESACKVLGSISSAPTKPIFFHQISILNHLQETCADLDARYPFTIELIYEVTRPLKNVELSVRIVTADGQPVFTTHQSDQSPESLRERLIGVKCVQITIPKLFLVPGSYLITLGAHEPMVQLFDFHENVMSFHINETGTKLAKYQNNRENGVVMVDLVWRNHQTHDV